MNKKELMSLLRNKGYKVTPQRLILCEFILSNESHPTAEQIYHEISKDNPTISLATVYKTIHLLRDIGLIQELGFSEKSTRYDPNVHPHINIVCPICGKISDYETKNIKKLWDLIISELGTKPLRQRMDFYIECDKWDEIKIRDSKI